MTDNINKETKKFIKKRFALCKFFNEINEGKYKGVIFNKNDETIFYAKIIDTKDDENWNMFLNLEDINGNYRSVLLDYYTDYLVKRLPFKWTLKYYWNKFKSLFHKENYENDVKEVLSVFNKKDEDIDVNVKTPYDEEINSILYNADTTGKMIYSESKKNSLLKDKIKWLGHNLFHCHCSDNEEQSCNVDIDEIIKNNSLEQIKKDNDKLSVKEKQALEQSVMNQYQREVLKEIDIKDRRQGRFGD